jgi:hypothetical protein
VAETTSGRLLAAEAAAALDRGSGGGVTAAAAAADGGGAGADEEVVPEDIGVRAAHLLLEEVQRGGVVDSSHQVKSLRGWKRGVCAAANLPLEAGSMTSALSGLKPRSNSAWR